MIVQPSPGQPPTNKPKEEFSLETRTAFFTAAFQPILKWLKGSEFLEWLLSLVRSIFAELLSWVLGAASWIATQIATSIAEGEEKSDAAFERLTQAAIKDLLGVTVQMGSLGKPGQRGHHALVAKSIGEGVMKGLFGPYDTRGAQETPATQQPALNFLTTVTNLAFEGWLEGWVVEALSLGQLERFADLDDTLVEALGIGRLSRRVLTVPMDILVTTPFANQMNQAYRPTRFGAGELCRQFYRGTITRDTLYQELAYLGYRDFDIEQIITSQSKRLSDADVLWLVEHDIWNWGEGIVHLRHQGYDEYLANTTLDLEREKNLEPIRRQILGEYINAYVAREIDSVRLRDALLASGLPESERDWLRTLADTRRALNRRSLSMSDVEAAIKRGILTIADYRKYLVDMGYSDDDARTLELLLMTEISDAAAAEAERKRLVQERENERKRKAEEQAKRRAEIESELTVRDVSLQQIESMVRRGLRTMEQYREWLRQRKYSADDVSALAELLSGQIADAQDELDRREQLRVEAQRKKVSIADLEKAVKLRLLSVEEYRSQLAAAGFGDEDRALLAGVLSREIQLADQAEAQREEARRRLAERHLSLDDLERAVRRGLRSVDSYRQVLIEQGFGSDDADLMAELLRQEIAEDQAARELRAEIEAKLQKKKISLAALERAVRAGVRTTAEYRALLVREGYSDTDADLLLRLMELTLAGDREADERRKAVADRMAQREISLADLERAVLVGVIDLAAYKKVLQREGFSAEDQRILAELLTRQIADVREAERKRAEAEKAAAKQHISLAALERAVRAGVRTITDYQLAVAGLGYDAAAQTTLVALLQRQMQQDQAARQLREQTEQTLRTRDLSLATMEKAVIQGLQTMSQYRSWLKVQGFRDEDVATLVSLLQLELAQRAETESA